MTKNGLCDKIIFMEKIFTSRKIKLTLLSALAFLFFSVGFLCFTPIKKTAAYQVYTGIEALLPATEVEQYSLSAPIDAVYDGYFTAIIERSNQSLLVYTKDAGYRTLSGVNLKQVKKFDESSLLVSDSGSIKIVDISNTIDVLSYSSFQYETSNPFGGTFFDLNKEYLITNYSSKANIYQLSGKEISQKLELSIDIASETPVAINDNNEIFYVVYNNGSYYICKRNVNDLINKIEFTNALSSKPSQIIANNDIIYFVVNNSLYKMKTDGTDFKALTVDGDTRYDLGNLEEPTGISFHEENLLIADPTVSAVQEFAVDGDTLKFTGYAVAKGKTAFNRISAQSTEIEHYKNLTAVLDENKLTVINCPDGFNTYDKLNFKNYFKEDMGFADSSSATLPNKFALGNDTALLNFGTNTVKLLNLSPMADEAELTFVSGIKTVDTVKDVCYQSGYYYLATTDATHSTVYKVDEKTATIAETFDFTGIIAELITVNVRGDIYIADGTNVYKNELTTAVCARDGATKLTTDLVGNLFALADNKIMQLSGGAFTTTETLGNVQAFTLGFDTEKAFYLLDGNESVFATTLLNNVGIDSLTAPDGYKVTDLETSSTTLDVWTADDSATVYAVTTSGASFNFEFKDLANGVSEYALLSKLSPILSNDGNVVFYALATPSGAVLIDEIYLTQQSKTWSDAPQSAYVTTDACAYYLPIISAPDTFALTRAIDDSGKIRLSKGTVIYPDSTTGKITFLEKEFYLATFDYNGQTRQGYVPVSFTVETPLIQSGYDTYSLERVKATKVYAENSLSTEVATLVDGATVRFYSSKNGVALIEYEVDGNWLTGYVKVNAIKNTPNLVVRNVLLILLVVASFAGTATFFILRKKKN